MRLNIKTHRRNKAVQQFDQYLRLSLAPVQGQLCPLSLRNSLEPPENFRNSDLSSFSKRNSISKKPQTPNKTLLSPQTQSKNSSLIQSLQFLSSKLLDAKTLLQRDTPIRHKPKTTPLLPLEGYGKGWEGGVGSKKQDKMEQSTLNLDSRKNFKNNANCKEKIVWANSLKHYYIGSVVRGMVGINDRAYQHLYESHQFFSCNLAFQPPKTYSPINLPCHLTDKHKKVLVIDMDETLVHCETEPGSNCEIQVQMGEGERGYISIRPYALSFLKKMSKLYQIIVFTASEKDYADAVLNQLDSQGLIKHRLYRQHCLRITKNLFTKDLRIINRDLSQMLLVDNSAASFLCQPENGVPILPYMGGEDRELLQLQKYLQLANKQEDVRRLNRKAFKLERYREFIHCEDLVAELYEDPTSYY